LVEFTGGSAEPVYLRLTSLLHWKQDTPSITVGELDQMYNSLCMSCCRFRRHRVRCFDGTGGGLWNDGDLRESSSLRR
jgi:hypothetical protein